MITAYNEGWEAGYKGYSYKNPYNKGIFNDQVNIFSRDWDNGFYDGKKEAAIDLADKRASSTK